GWELTELGRQVAAEAAGIEGVVEQVLRVSAGGADGIRGSVRVVAPEGFGVAFATPALARVCGEHPDVSVELVTSTRPLSLRGAGYDLAVTVGAAATSRLLSEPLAEYSIRLYASRDYLRVHAPIRTLDDLREHALVYYVDALLSVRELDLAPLLGGMRVSFASTNVAAQLEATRRGAGIGLLHAFAAHDDADLVPVLPQEVEFRLQFSLSMRPESRGSAAVEAVRAALVAEVRGRHDELLP
ncbi:MAG: LysR substrate-binding domain-containing protein, partial [Chloroflexota bacterium]|nr:LysR substrate-binding domain-containing protein [Chloroflexota bacterium]